MQFITVRDLRRRPGQVWTKLIRERKVILTSNGKPIAILSAVSEENLERTLTALRQARAIGAVERMQSTSIAMGNDRLTTKEIGAEIATVREARPR